MGLGFPGPPGGLWGRGQWGAARPGQTREAGGDQQQPRRVGSRSGPRCWVAGPCCPHPAEPHGVFSGPAVAQVLQVLLLSFLCVPRSLVHMRAGLATNTRRGGGGTHGLWQRPSSACQAAHVARPSGPLGAAPTHGVVEGHWHSLIVLSAPRPGFAPRPWFPPPSLPQPHSLAGPELAIRASASTSLCLRHQPRPRGGACESPGRPSLVA